MRRILPNRGPKDARAGETTFDDQTFARCRFALAGLMTSQAAFAQISDNVVRIGILGDMSGPNADQQGPGDMVAARMAVADFGGLNSNGKMHDAPIEIIGGDLLGKTDIGVGIARRWFDQGVDAIFSLGNSSVAIAVQALAQEKNRVTIATSAGSDVLTNKACTPVSLHWTYDTYAMPAALAQAIVGQGGRDWYFLTIDYAFGHSMQAQAARFVLAGGGHVLGDTPHPPGETDFSASLGKAAEAGATVLGLATSGAPMMNALKQFQEFGLNKTMRPAALLTGHHRSACLGPSGDAGPAVRRGVLLGSERGNPRLRRAVPEDSWRDADDVPGQCLRGGDTLPEGDRRHWHR